MHTSLLKSAATGLLLILLSILSFPANTNAMVPPPTATQVIELTLQDIRDEQKIQNDEPIDCSKVSIEAFERIGNAFMDIMHPDSTQHELMDSMMGGEDSVSLTAMHSMMGAQYLGCTNENIPEEMQNTWNSMQGGMMGMMSGSGMMNSGMMNMMGSSGTTGMMGNSGMMGNAGSSSSMMNNNSGSWDENTNGMWNMIDGFDSGTGMMGSFAKSGMMNGYWPIFPIFWILLLVAVITGIYYISKKKNAEFEAPLSVTKFGWRLTAILEILYLICVIFLLIFWSAMGSSAISMMSTSIMPMGFWPLGILAGAFDIFIISWIASAIFVWIFNTSFSGNKK